MDTQAEYRGAEQIAQALGVSRGTVYQWVSRGGSPVTIYKRRGRLVALKADADRAAQDLRVVAGPA